VASPFSLPSRLLILVGGAALCAEHFSGAGPGLVLALRLFAAGVFSGLGTRSEKLLSQWTLSGLLGWKQPQGARPELGERNPTMETLLVLIRKLRRRFAFAVDPPPATPCPCARARLTLSSA
jgi:hypothetical protein